VRTTRLDLLDHNDFFRLNLHVLIGQYVAQNQTKKSIEARIHRAQRLNAPTCGKRPFGRLWNGTTWEIDPAKQRMMLDVAKRYLAGEAIPSIAKRHNVNASALHKTLTQRCGSIWEQSFQTVDGPSIVKTAVPPLLPEETIAAIHRRIKANKTYTHGQTKHRYMLGRMIFCGHCGYAMSGQANHKGRDLYYRHCHQDRTRPCNVKHGYVPAHEIEPRVIDTLFDMLGNPVALRKALADAVPNADQIAERRQQLKQNTDDLAKIERGRDRILKLIADDRINDDQAAKQLDDLKSRQRLIVAELDRIRDSLSNAPTIEQIESTVHRYTDARRAACAALLGRDDIER
jgi:hypothetical protein